MKPEQCLRIYDELVIYRRTADCFRTFQLRTI